MSVLRHLHLGRLSEPPPPPHPSPSSLAEEGTAMGWRVAMRVFWRGGGRGKRSGEEEEEEGEVGVGGSVACLVRSLA